MPSKRKRKRPDPPQNLPPSEDAADPDDVIESQAALLIDQQAAAEKQAAMQAAKLSEDRTGTSAQVSGSAKQLNGVPDATPGSPANPSPAAESEAVSPNLRFFKETPDIKALKEAGEAFASMGKGVDAAFSTVRVAMKDYGDDLETQAADYEKAKEKARAFAESIPLVGGVIGELQGALVGLGESILGSPSESLKDIQAQSTVQQKSMLATGAVDRAVGGEVASISATTTRLEHEHYLQGLSGKALEAQRVKDRADERIAEISRRAALADEMNIRGSAAAIQPIQDRLRQLEPDRRGPEEQTARLQKKGLSRDEAITKLGRAERPIVEEYDALESQREKANDEKKRRAAAIAKAKASGIAEVNAIQEDELADVNKRFPTAPATPPSTLVAPPNAAARNLGGSNATPQNAGSDRFFVENSGTPLTPILTHIEKLIQSIADTLPAIAAALGKKGPVAP